MKPVKRRDKKYFMFFRRGVQLFNQIIIIYVYNIINEGKYKQITINIEL